MKEFFINKRFAQASLDIIEQANLIIDEYQAQGFTLTLRQLYYQFVARGLIPNLQSEYKRIGSIINDARLAGLMDWEMIEDRTRNLQELNKWRDPQHIIEESAEIYRSDIWGDQDTRVEVWIEKEALVGVIEPVCHEFRVPYFACRGYGSQSELWRAGRRFREHAENEQSIVVLHLGDHDPSGIDMTRDNEERLSLFAGERASLEVRRVALNINQVHQYNPPPNPAKTTDSRHKPYIQRFGQQSWELDALDPRVISDLIRSHIEPLIDVPRWNAVIEAEREAREIMKGVSDKWDLVSEHFKGEA